MDGPYPHGRVKQNRIQSNSNLSDKILSILSMNKPKGKKRKYSKQNFKDSATILRKDIGKLRRPNFAFSSPSLLKSFEQFLGKL